MNAPEQMPRHEAAAWPRLERIAVFRALNLGDLLCFMPALRALRQAFPHASIALIGLESARSLIERFPHYVDELIVFPGLDSFPEQKAKEDELPAFYRRMQARGFDLALQMHGDGTRSNAVVERLGARLRAGFVPRDERERQGRWMRWPDDLNEVHRYLALLEHLGIAAGDDRLEFPLCDDDLASADSLLAGKGMDAARTVVLHPGARLASRRWPIDRFMRVGKALVAQGWQIAVTGSPAEAELTRSLAAGIGPGAVDLCGATSLGQLAAVLRRCRLLVCNDTGISHVAAAVEAPSVVIASGSDVNRWAPLDARLHPVLHAPAACRPCAFDLCPVGHVCALGVDPDSVVGQAQAQLKRARTHTFT